MLDQREDVASIEALEDIIEDKKFNKGMAYRNLQNYGHKVMWKNLLYGNNARSRASFIFWLACHERLATKYKLYKFSLTDNTTCYLCLQEESIRQLLFECDTMKQIWMEVLQWVQVPHIPGNWHEETKWLVQQTKGKGMRAAILKMAAAETIYELWKNINNKSFGEPVDITKIGKRIIDTLVYRG
ncbi:uncharacterized protein LOC131657519 [Vicia villosa]|uniref:uncharacterized protein LOC131657519 n=1 Tax=Vicia villosa TaxID=3911 RepID=UPI00273B2CD7|nr:uncharacterized protein LOC131657519 [Vicia villosa]